jgi:prepilin-type N-terminal cleavage/methylation domain-containing protein
MKNHAKALCKNNFPFFRLLNSLPSNKPRSKKGSYFCTAPKTQNPIFKKQSAFSLIEVLIALVILSFGITGTGKLLVESSAGYSVLQQRAEALMIASAIVDSLSMDQSGALVAQTTRYWQNKLDNALPGSSLKIGHQKFEDKCVYTITLSFASARQKTLILKIAV